MSQSVPLDYPTVCQYVGQLFLETRHALERLTSENEALRQRAAAAEQARDEAVRALTARAE